jgi:hypothetical protein
MKENPGNSDDLNNADSGCRIRLWQRLSVVDRPQVRRQKIEKYLLVDLGNAPKTLPHG